MPTPATGSTIKFTDVTTEFTLSVNPPSRAIGADFRFAGGAYTPASPAIPTGATATISLSGDLGGRTKVSAGNSGIPLWIATMNFGVAQQGSVCCVDPSENIYVGGALTITTATAYNAGTTTGTNSTYVATTLGGAAIAKYNSSGIVQWVTEIDGAGNDQFGFCTFTNNLYVCGRAGTSWPTAYNAGSSTVGQTISGTGPTGATIGFYIAKYNSSGIAQYMIGYGCSNGTGTFSHTIDTDPSENIYFAGRAGGPGQSVWAFGPGGGTNINYPTPGTSTGINCVVIKWNASGTPLWMAMIRSNGAGYGTGVAWNSAANQLGVTANSGGSIQAIAYNANQNPTSTGITCTKASSASSTLVTAYNTSGTVLWTTIVDGTLTSDVKACGFLTSDSSGNWYVCGTTVSGVAPTAYSAGTTTGTVAALTPLLTGAWLVKFNSSGAVQWITMVDSPASVNNFGMSVKADSGGNVYFTTFCNSGQRTVSAYNAGSSTPALTSRVPSGCPWTVWKYNSSGIVQNVIVAYNGANYNSQVGNNAIINSSLYSTFTGTAGAIVWTVYGSDNATTISSANTGTGVLVKFT